MGADFIHSVCPLPANVTDEIKEEINLRVCRISNDIAHSILEEFHHDWGGEVRERIEERLGEQHLFGLNDITNTFKKEMAQEIINEALEEVVYDQNRRDIGHMFLEHRWWLVSGGMSWGDPPTDAMRYIDIIDESKVLHGLNY